MEKTEQGYTSWDVFLFVRGIHEREQDFHEGNIRENIEFWAQYELKEVQVDSLQNPYEYDLDDYLLEEYADMDVNTIPPLVVGYYDDSDAYLTLDGNHRVAIMRKKNIARALAYVAVKGSETDD